METELMERKHLLEEKLRHEAEKGLQLQGSLEAAFSAGDMVRRHKGGRQHMGPHLREPHFC